MRKVAAKIGAAVVSGVAAVSLLASPALADSEMCRGECTTRPVFANGNGHFVDVRVVMDDNFGLWCSWTVRDYDNNALVGSGTAFDEGGSNKRISGLYNRYKLFVSNSSCWGIIDNNP